MQKTDDIDEYRAYAGQYPKGKHIGEAWRRIGQKEAAEGGKTKASQENPLRPGRVFKDCPECAEMVVIPAGSFEMGSPDSEAGRSGDEGPQHRVSIGKPFALGKTEVTVGEFRRFVRDTGYRTDAEKNSGGQQGCFTRDKSDNKWAFRAGRYWDKPGLEQTDRQPVTCVSWTDAHEYVDWLSKKAGQTYRLPSEAEWEYAARAGTNTSRYWGDNPDQACAYANVADLSKGPIGNGWDNMHQCNDGYWFTAPVGHYRPNAFGLYDMLGNSWEWVEDCASGGYSGAPSDGSAGTSGDCSMRVLRGGSWNNDPQGVRSARRYRDAAGRRGGNFGFRLARTLF